MDLSTFHQINGLLDPSLILIETLARVMLIARFFRCTARLLYVLNEVYVMSISFFGSKAFPFFHTANAMAEIFRASVIVASSCFRPRTNNPE
jgi:hypothetical protein